MVIADTGFWLALANRQDRHHSLAKERLSQMGTPLISTWPVLTETCHLLLTRLGARSQVAFLESFARGAFQVFDLAPEHAPQIARLMKKYRDLPMDLADASLVILAEYLGHGKILSTDNRDFGACRWKKTQPFDNLLL